MPARAGYAEELFLDFFCGGGGASTGIEQATGLPVDYAINHSDSAIRMHRTNHSRTIHLREDVWEVNPDAIVQGRPVGLAWFSPDCTFFSRARGGKPKDKKIRSLPWIVVKWAMISRPRVIVVENVVEFQDWGPLDEKGYPIAEKKGETFRKWKKSLLQLGYQVEHRALNACDYGAPTTRKRFFLIARCDGRPITWPQPTHGDPNSLLVHSGGLKPLIPASSIIDWSIPCPSIFASSEEIKRQYGVQARRPLEEKTLQRIARGIRKFIIEAQDPFIVPQEYTATAHSLIQYHGDTDGRARGQPLQNPLMTVDASNRYAMVTAFLAKHYGGGYTGAGIPMDQPVSTVTGVDHHALVAANVIKFQQNSVGQPVGEPLHTVMAGATRFGVVTSNLMVMRNNCFGQSMDEPLHTVTAGTGHFAEVRSFLVKYYGTATGQALNEPVHTITANDRLALVTIHGVDYIIVDIGMRMLTPRELYLAMGFPMDYAIYQDDTGITYTKKEIIARCGNAVPPPFAEAITRADLPEYCGVTRLQTMKQLDMALAVA